MLVIKDFATTTIASALTAAATSIVVSDASRLPALPAGDHFDLVLQKFTDRNYVEIVRVTGVSGNTLTVARGRDGTIGRVFSIGDYAEVRLTVGVFSTYVSQLVEGKVDKDFSYVNQRLQVVNTGDLVGASLALLYAAGTGHGTIVSGGEGVNKQTPYIALRPLGHANAATQLKYTDEGALSLVGGTRSASFGFILSEHSFDSNGFPNAVDNDANNYVNRARSKITAGNSGLHFLADAALDARLFGIQSGHSSAANATSYGILDLNPFGGLVRVNGGSVYHTGYAPTPAAVGALALSGGTLTGILSQNMSGYGVRFLASGGSVYLQGGKVDSSADQKMVLSGFNGVPLTNFNILTATHGLATINGARLYTEQYLPTPDVLGCVPSARTINSKPLSANIALTAADVGALPIAGGSLGGSVVVHSSAPKNAVTSLTAAPLVRQLENVGVVSSFIPFGHMSAHAADGYVTHLNFGLYKRGVGTWDGSGMYVATGGFDGSPTEFFLLEYGGKITHSRGHTFYHTGNKPTAADVGALPVTGGTVSGVLGVTTELHLVGSSAYDMADIVWRAPDGTERGRLWTGGAIGADNSLTWRSGAGGATHKIYHEGNKPTASDVGAAPAGFGLGGYGTAIGSVLWDTPLRRQSGFFQGSYIEGLPTSPHSWNYVFNQAHGNAAGYFGYLAINFNCSKAWIGGQEGGAQKGPFELVKQGDRFVANNAVGTDYHQCAIEVNGNTAIDSRPGIGFHMAGRFAGMLHLWEGGDFRFHTQGLASYAGIITGNVNANDVYIRSDRRLKKNLVEVRDALRKVSSLTAYSYDKKQTLEATEYDKKEVGLIAQDVEQVLPEAVTRVVDSSNKDGTEILTLSNSALIALLVGAVKELSEKVKELEYGRT